LYAGWPEDLAVSLPKGQLGYRPPQIQAILGNQYER
jgi:hypothetical protein